MGAGDRWHEHGPVKVGDPIISPAILLLVQGQGGAEEQSVMPCEADREAAFGPESRLEGSPESEEVLANLLRAIENTDIAALFPSVTPPENGHPPAPPSAQTAEFAVSTLRQVPVPEMNAAACSRITPNVGAESNEAITHLLHVLHDAEVAATLDGIPQANCAGAVDSAHSNPAATAETAFTTAGGTAINTASDIESMPPDPLEIRESTAGSLSVFVNPGSNGAPAPLEVETTNTVLPGQEQSTATASIPEPPFSRPQRNTLRQHDRHPKRVVRRRNSDRRRRNSLLSIVAPDSPSATPSAAADAPAAELLAATLDPAIEEPLLVAVEPEPAAPGASAEPVETLNFALAPAVPVPPTSSKVEATHIIEPFELAESAEPQAPLTAMVTEEPERPLAAEPALTEDSSILPATGEAASPIAPIRARLSTGIGNLAATGDLISEGLDRAEMRLENWFQKWLGPPDPRRNARVDNPPLVAYHWIVDVPQALKIADVSAGGLHLVTKDRWSEGNIVSMTLQRTDREKGSPDSWIAVDFLVMRWCDDGMAGAFMPSVRGLAHTVAGRAANCADKKTLERFMNRLINAAADRSSVRK